MNRAASIPSLPSPVMELYAEAYSQLASMSAVLGGLAFAAAAALLGAATTSSDATILDWPAKMTIVTATAGAVLLLIAAMTWSFMAADLYRAAAGSKRLSYSVGVINAIASLEMIVGFVLLLVSIGTSGWIASRRIGLVTSTVALVGCTGLGLLVFWFAEL